MVSSLYSLEWAAPSASNSLDEATLLSTKRKKLLTADYQSKLKQLEHYKDTRTRKRSLKNKRKLLLQIQRTIFFLKSEADEIDQVSANKIQALFRGFSVRKGLDDVSVTQYTTRELRNRILSEIRESEEHSYFCLFNVGDSIHTAATTIQKHIRGYKTRKKWIQIWGEAKEKFRKQMESANAISVIFRTYSARQEVELMQDLRNRDCKMNNLKERIAKRRINGLIERYIVRKRAEKEQLLQLAGTKRQKTKTKWPYSNRTKLNVQQQQSPKPTKHSSITDLLLLTEYKPLMDERELNSLSITRQTNAGTNRAKNISLKRHIPRHSLNSSILLHEPVLSVPPKTRPDYQYLNNTEASYYRAITGSRPPTPEFIKKKKKTIRGNMTWNFTRPTVSSMGGKGKFLFIRRKFRLGASVILGSQPITPMNRAKPAEAMRVSTPK